MGQCRIEDGDFASLSIQALRKLENAKEKLQAWGQKTLRAIRLKIS
jgi:hypothetical protein